MDTDCSSRGKNKTLSRRKGKKDKKPGVKLPCDALKYEYVNDEKQLSDLDIRLFVAGELGLILGQEGKRGSEAERLGRMKLLESIMYHAGNCLGDQ